MEGSSYSDEIPPLPANGNTLQFDLNADGAWDNSTPDGYDIENHLISASRPMGNITILCDGDGNRLKKTVGSATTYYIVDDQNPTGYPHQWAQTVEKPLLCS